MEKEIKITAPDECEIKNVEIVNGIVVVTFKEKKQKLPKSWEEFCELNPLTLNDCFITQGSSIGSAHVLKSHNARRISSDRNLLPNFETAEAVLALMQLIRLRNCYNGNWVPDWCDRTKKYVLEFSDGEIHIESRYTVASSPLYFKTLELCKEFLHNFLPLIEKLKLLYGIKEEGEE